jgi:hypothetical protein
MSFRPKGEIFASSSATRIQSVSIWQRRFLLRRNDKSVRSVYYYFYPTCHFDQREKSSQVALQREYNLCRSGNEDFSFVEMTNLCVQFIIILCCMSFPPKGEITLETPQRRSLIYVDFRV